jgi:ABC-type amino acid transport substrate-binding protein
MIASILLLSLLTGVIASVLTVQQLDTGIAHPRDLRHVRAVTVASSTSADYLRRRYISFQTRPTAQAALRAVADGQADAVVYDQALLKYLANTEFVGIVQVLPVSFNTQEYAIALRPESPLRKPLNEALLRYRASDGWDELIYRFLGD